MHLGNENYVATYYMNNNGEVTEISKVTEQLDLMFMKHYAPNRCLYIKVAKLRTRVGVQRHHTYKIAVSSYSKSTSKSKSAKGDYSKKIKSLFSNFHQLISSSSSIS